MFVIGISCSNIDYISYLLTCKITNLVTDYKPSNHCYALAVKLVFGKCHPMGTGKLESKWKEVAEVLNNLNGARKVLKQWKSISCKNNFFTEYKAKVRKKAREHKTLVQTGGGGFINKELSDIENRLMGVIRWISVTEIHPNAFEVNPLTSTSPNNDIDVNELLEMLIIEYIVEENGDDQSPVA
ncbi:hypothetical protein FQA39_LY15066 [Lamprigera yunnana]|nr:hypothetical protein FQA39_LY15066 [Lamprigera yunnana]